MESLFEHALHHKITKEQMVAKRNKMKEDQPVMKKPAGAGSSSSSAGPPRDIDDGGLSARAETLGAESDIEEGSSASAHDEAQDVPAWWQGLDE
eukprot:12658093-Alexandrium_andersonii.AAC.1